MLTHWNYDGAFDSGRYAISVQEIISWFLDHLEVAYGV